MSKSHSFRGVAILKGKVVGIKMVHKIVRGIDRTIEIIGALMMLIMTIIIIYEVFGRYVLHAEPSWSEEVSLLLMTAFGFLSICIGFRYGYHLRLTFIVDRFSPIVKKFLEILSHILVIGFGILLLVEGYNTIVLTWPSTLPSTGLPGGVQYIIIPVTGVVTMLYGLRGLLVRKEKSE
jgi:TRAP-type C4-dicarboxylate transport system permease small subunit